MKLWISGLGVGLSCLLAACAVVEFGVGGTGGTGAAAPTGGGGAETSAGGFGGAADGGAGAATSTTTDMGGSTITNMGGAPQMPVIDDTGLVARYYLDEAASGSPDGSALDAAPDPLDLPITWPVLGQLHYAETGGQRGLECSTAGLDGRASVPDMTATKVFAALAGSPTGTLEVVLSVAGVHMSNSRFIHIGTTDESGRFTLSAGSLDEINFYWRPNAVIPTDDLAGHWPITFTAGERIVLHAVLDSNQPAEADRARLYRNGVLVGGNDTKTPVGQGEVINLESGHAFVLGNREIGVRSFNGTLFYAAVYNAALTQAEVLNNVAVLLASDDKPEP